MDDSYLVASIKKGGLTREKALKYIFKKNFSYQNIMLQKYGSKLNIADIEDAYINALTALWQQIENDKYQSQAKISTYFYIIVERKCYDILRKKDKENNISLSEEFPEPLNFDSDPLDDLIRKEEKDRALSTFDKLSDKCKEILTLWINKYNMKEIAKITGFKNANTAKSKKEDCMRKLKSLIPQP